MTNLILRRVMCLALLLPLAASCDDNYETQLDVTPVPLLRVQGAQLVDVTVAADPIGTCDGCTRIASVVRAPRNSGTVRLTFVLDRPASSDVSFTLNRLNPSPALYNAATAGSDFDFLIPTGTVVTIPAGQTTVSLDVATILQGSASTVDGLAIPGEVFGFTIPRASQIGLSTGGYPTVFEWLIEIV